MLNAGEQAATPSSKRVIQLELMGSRLSVLSDNDDARVQELVQFLNTKFEALRNSPKKVPQEQAMLLVALNLAEELFEVRRQLAEVRGDVEFKSRKLLRTLDELAGQLGFEIPMAQESPRA